MGKVESEFSIFTLNKWYRDEDGWFRRLRGPKMQHLTHDGDGGNHVLWLVPLDSRLNFDSTAEICTRLELVVFGLDLISHKAGSV